MVWILAGGWVPLAGRDSAAAHAGRSNREIDGDCPRQGHLVVGVVSRADHLHALRGSSQRAAGNERLFTGRRGSGRNRQQSGQIYSGAPQLNLGGEFVLLPDNGLDPKAVPAFAGGLIERGGDTRGEYRTYAGGGNQPSDKG
jgi:hypothetical protein